MISGGKAQTSKEYTWNQKKSYPEPEPTAQPDSQMDPNTPSWYSNLIAYMNALRTELLTKMEQCCSKNNVKNNIWTLRKFRENLGDQKKTRMSYGQDYSDDDYDESGPQPYMQIRPKAYADNDHQSSYHSSTNNPSSYHSKHGADSSYDVPLSYAGASSYKKPSAYGHASTYETKTYQRPLYYRRKASPKPYASTSPQASYYKTSKRTYYNEQNHNESPHAYENNSPSYYGKLRQSPRSYGQSQSYRQRPISYSQGYHQRRPQTYWDMEGPGPHNPKSYGLSSYDIIVDSNPYKKRRTYSSSSSSNFGSEPSGYQNSWSWRSTSTRPGAYNARASVYNGLPLPRPRVYNEDHSKPSTYSTMQSAYNSGPHAYNAGIRTYNAGPKAYNAGPSASSTRPKPYNSGPSPYNAGEIPLNDEPSTYNVGPSVHTKPSAYHKGHSVTGIEREVPEESEVANPTSHPFNFSLKIFKLLNKRVYKVVVSF